MQAAALVQQRHGGQLDEPANAVMSSLKKSISMSRKLLPLPRTAYTTLPVNSVM